MHSVKFTDRLILCFVFIVFFSRCTVVPVIDQWKNLKNYEWAKNKPLEIPVIITDTNFYYTLSINLRVTNDYKYSNLWIKLSEMDPVGVTKSQNIMLTLSDHRGKWTGHNLGHIISFRIPALKDKVYLKTGKYRYRLEQFMRDPVLKEVVSVGLQLEKQQAILK